MPRRLPLSALLLASFIGFSAGCGSSSPPSGGQSSATTGTGGGGGGAGGAGGGGFAELPSDWDEAVRLPTIVDENPANDVLEVTLHATAGMGQYIPEAPSPIWGFEGTSPGPLLRGRRGDRLIVHFKNDLAVPLTIHWHGMRVPNDMDGAPMVVSPIEPGAQFDYDFTLPDPGTYWYHPHVVSNLEVSMGLYGAIVVDPAEGDPDPLASFEMPEATLVLDDVGVEADGTLSPYDKHGNLGDFFGREGDILLVNGKVLPTIKAQPGLPLRLRFVNAAVARYFVLALEGHTFSQIATDGGLITAPKKVAELLVVPGGRAEVVLTPKGQPGELLTMRWLPFDRGYCTDCRDPEDLFFIELVDGPPPQDVNLPEALTTITPIDTTNAAVQQIDLTQVTVNGEVVLGINGQAFGEGVTLLAAVGETQILRVNNTTEGDHPFHLHGYFFQPIEVGGVPYGPTEQWDTFNVPKKQSADLAVYYDGRPGMWMLHCHILDHAEIGMMAMLHVMP